jgi:DNA-binding MarR family transcriptional regulator
MRRVGQLYDDILAPCGLRSTQYTLLAHIERLKQPAISALAAELVMDRSALAHTLQPLQRDGLILVAPDPRDRRTKRAEITQEGRRRLAEAEDLWRQGQARFEAAFGQGDAADLRVMMDRMASEAFVEDFQKAG